MYGDDIINDTELGKNKTSSDYKYGTKKNRRCYSG